MRWLEQLKLDTWFKPLIYVGGLIVLIALKWDIQIVSNEIMAGIGFGMFLYGIGRWKNRKTKTQFGRGAKLSWEERDPDFIGIFLEVSGVVMIFIAIGYAIVKNPQCL